MELIIRRSKTEDAEALLEVQKESFNEDLLKYEDFDTSPANEPIERLIRKINNFYYYTVLLDNEVIGGVDVRKVSDTQCRLNRIFLKVKCHNQGIGTKEIYFIENEFPDVTEWSLDTPFKSYRNHHLYEKIGYKKVGEHRVTDKLVLFDYVKLIDSHKDDTR